MLGGQPCGVVVELPRKVAGFGRAGEEAGAGGRDGEQGHGGAEQFHLVQCGLGCPGGQRPTAGRRNASLSEQGAVEGRQDVLMDVDPG